MGAAGKMLNAILNEPEKRLSRQQLYRACMRANVEDKAGVATTKTEKVECAISDKL